MRGVFLDVRRIARHVGNRKKFAQLADDAVLVVHPVVADFLRNLRRRRRSGLLREHLRRKKRERQRNQDVSQGTASSNIPVLTTKALELFLKGISRVNLILAGKRSQLRKFLARCPRADHETSQSPSFAETVCDTRSDKCSSRIDHDDVARWPGFAFQNAPDQRCIFSSSSSANGFERRARHANLFP